MKRLLLVMLAALALASCGGHPDYDPYGSDCFKGLVCNGHYLPD